MNMHPNFKNLNPIYDDLRYERTLKLANLWRSLLGEKLNARVEALIRKDFNQYISGGNKLDMVKIQALSHSLKTDYITH
jgi:hypothetical protein